MDMNWSQHLLEPGASGFKTWRPVWTKLGLVFKGIGAQTRGMGKGHCIIDHHFLHQGYFLEPVCSLTIPWHFTSKRCERTIVLRIECQWHPEAVTGQTSGQAGVSPQTSLRPCLTFTLSTLHIACSLSILSFCKKMVLSVQKEERRGRKS